MKNFIIPVLSLLVALGALAFAFGYTHPASAPPSGSSSAGPEDLNPYHCTAGVCQYFYRSVMTSATTTPCNFKSPNATTTLIRATARLDVSSTTATQLFWAKATTPSATTTNFGYGTLSANAKGTFAASTTPYSAFTSTIDTPQMLAPNSYVVFGMAGGIGTFSPTGACQVVLEAI